MISENIRKLRESKGLSQKELAEMAGTTQPIIAAFELGDKVPSVRLVKAMSRALEVTTDNIILGE